VLLLYAVVGLIFLASLLFLGAGQVSAGSFGGVVALISSGALWVLVRRTPKAGDWIYPVAVVPTLSCGIAYAMCGRTGAAYLVLIGAPFACAAVLFELPVMLAALATAIATVSVCLAQQMSGGAALVSTLLLAPVAGISGWVIFQSAHALRSARGRLQQTVARNEALLRSMPDILVLADRLGRVLDVHIPSKDGRRFSRQDLVGRTIDELVPGVVGGRMRETLTKALELGTPQKFEYAK
jgi:PAS domain-containing protein